MSPSPATIPIVDGLAIPLAELTFTASRSSGPGGQNVNKVNSRVTLRFDVGASPSLDESQRLRLQERLATRITNDGVLVMHAQMHRSQAANRELLVERFAEVLRGALRRRKKRRATRPSKGSVERRLAQKQRRSDVKRGRRGSYDRD